MKIKSKLIQYLNRIANDTPEANLRKDLIPIIRRKHIEDKPDHAIIVGRFISLLVSSYSSILAKDPTLQKLSPLHNTLKRTYENPQVESVKRPLKK